MAKEMNWPALLTVGVICILLGGVIGAFGFATTEIVEKTVTVEKEVKVPVEVEVTKEVIVEVPAPSVLDKALATFLKAVEDEEDEAGNDITILEYEEYDFNEISVSKVYDDYNVTYVDDCTVVDFKVKLKFKVEGETSHRMTYNVTVTYQEDEDSTVKYT